MSYASRKINYQRGIYLNTQKNEIKNKQTNIVFDFRYISTLKRISECMVVTVLTFNFRKVQPSSMGKSVYKKLYVLVFDNSE